MLQVDVADVYRHGAPVRAEPLPGMGSFLQEEIQKQRELHSTSHFLTAAAAVNQRAQTLPLIVHHKVPATHPAPIYPRWSRWRHHKRRHIHLLVTWSGLMHALA